MVNAAPPSPYDFGVPTVAELEEGLLPRNYTPELVYPILKDRKSHNILEIFEFTGKLNLQSITW